MFDGTGFHVLAAGDGLPEGLKVKELAFDEKNRILFGTTEGVRFPDGKTWKPPSASTVGKVDALAAAGDVVWVGHGTTLHRIENGKTTSFKMMRTSSLSASSTTIRGFDGTAPAKDSKIGAGASGRSKDGLASVASVAP